MNHRCKRCQRQLLTVLDKREGYHRHCVSQDLAELKAARCEEKSIDLVDAVIDAISHQEFHSAPAPEPFDGGGGESGGGGASDSWSDSSSSSSDSGSSDSGGGSDTGSSD